MTIRGAGNGALLGQAIGNDTESTIVGGVIGAGVGRVVGTEKEKAKAAQAPPPAKPATTTSATTQTAPKAETSKPAKPEDLLAETIWKLEKIQPKDRVPEFFSKIVTFRTDGFVQTLTTTPEGLVTLSEETYSAVGDTLVVNKPDYTIQARFKVDGDQLIVSADDFSAIFSRIIPE